MEKLIVLSGKARSGKDTCVSYIEKYYTNKKCITVSFAYYLKDYLKRMHLYEEGEKPRTLMQEFGSFLRKEMGEDFLIQRVLEDIKIFGLKYDMIIVTDCRLKTELKALKENYPACVTIRVKRENYDNKLTEKEKRDITEIDLDTSVFDYVIVNDEKIKQKVEEILKEVEV